MTRKAYRPEEDLFGYRTVVTDKSVHGLPNDISREQQTGLPPGSATPNSPRQEDTAEGNGRHLGGPSYNVPDGESDVSERSRTLPTPGGLEGVTTKFDYGHLTRRSIQAVEAAYTPRTPWRRQRRQVVWDRLEDREKYRQNKPRVKQRMKLWYKRVHKDRRYLTRKKERREDPVKYKRRKQGGVSVERVVQAYVPTSLGQHRRRQHGPAKLRSHRNYLHNRARAHRQHKIWYQRNKNKPAFKRKQLLRRKNPARFHLRPGSEVGLGVWLVYGPRATPACVVGVSPEAVTFEDVETGVQHTLTPQAFMQAVAFLDEDSINRMLSLLDERGGDDPYGDPTLHDLLAVVDLYGMTAAILRDVPAPLDAAVLCVAEDVMEGWDYEPDMVTRVAMRHLRATGEILLYDQEPQGDWEKPDAEKRPYRSESPGQWTDTDPGPTHDPSSGGLPSYDTTPNFGGGSGKVIPDHLKMATTLADIESGTASDVRARARGVKVHLAKADPKRGIWTFRADGSAGRSYTVKVQAVAKGNTKDVGKLHLRVSCDCDFFRYQGPEHHAKADGYLYGKPRGTAAIAHEKDPKGNHKACKHALAALTLARRYKVAAGALARVGSFTSTAGDLAGLYGAYISGDISWPDFAQKAGYKQLPRGRVENCYEWAFDRIRHVRPGYAPPKAGTGQRMTLNDAEVGSLIVYMHDHVAVVEAGGRVSMVLTNVVDEEVPEMTAVLARSAYDVPRRGPVGVLGVYAPVPEMDPTAAQQADDLIP